MIDDGGEYDYEYDAWNRLTAILVRNTSTVVAEYRYNGLGQRIAEGDGTDTEYLIYDDRWRLISGYDGASDYLEETFYHHAGLDGYGGASDVDSVLMRRTFLSTGTPQTEDQRWYVLQNWRQDVVAIIVYLVVGTVIALAGCGASRPTALPPYDRQVSRGLVIHQHLDIGSIPEHWTDPPIEFDAAELGNVDFELASKALRLAATSIPADYFNENSLDVYLLASITLYDLQAGGTVWGQGRAVYIVFDDENGKSGGLNLQQWFFTEFGRVLVRNHPDSSFVSHWYATLPAGFQYSGDSVAAVKQGNGRTSWTLRDLQDGFLGTYARSDFETDMSLYIAAVLSNEPAFNRARQAFPAVEAKSQLIESFLSEVNPHFTERWLRSIKPYPLSSQDRINSGMQSTRE
jgi:hypothetical protein